MEFAMVYVGICTLAIVLAYTICRLVDHVFTSKENMEKVEMIEHIIGYSADSVKYLSRDVIKQINDGLLQMTKDEDA